MKRGIKLLEYDAKPTWALDEKAWAHAEKLAAGCRGQHDYQAVVTQLYKQMGGKVGNPAVIIPPPEITPDEKALAMITAHPEMSAATLLNSLKAQGLELKDKTKEEADSGSSFAQDLRSKVESHKITILGGRFIEASAMRDNGIGPTVFKVILIQEGMGNFGTCFYYTKPALQSAIALFEGKKIYADHASEEEAINRPERSVRDVLGYFQGVKLEIKEGRAMLTADVHMMDEKDYAWARGLMRQACEYAKKFPDKDFVGLSINAAGDAQEAEIEEFMRENQIPESAKPKLLKAREDGISTIRVVHQLTEATSCDLVTEAGAGGRVLDMIEQEKNLMGKKKASAKVEETKETKESKETKETENIPTKEAEDTKHDDAAQDVELVKSMLKKYVGKKDEEIDEADIAMGREAYYAAKEMGYEGEECMQAAGYGMKMSSHMASKKAEACKKEAEAQAAKDKEIQEAADKAAKEEADKKEIEAKEAAVKAGEGPKPMEIKESEQGEEDTDDEPEGTDGADKAADPVVTKEAESTTHDSKDEQILKLTARLGVAEGKLKDIELGNYLDKRCKESGLPNALTSKFKETLGKPKSNQHIDDTLKIFVEAAKVTLQEHTKPGFVLSVEKVEGEDSRNAVSFSDCLRDE